MYTPLLAPRRLASPQMTARYVKVKSNLPRFGGFARRPSRHIQTNLKAVYDRGAGRMLVMCKLDSALVSI